MALPHNLAFRHPIIPCLLLDLVPPSSLTATASWIVPAFRLAERLAIDGAWLSPGTAETITAASSKPGTVTGAGEESSAEGYMEASHLQEPDRRSRHHRAVHMHVLVIEPLPRQHQQMAEAPAELTSAWLSNQPGLNPCRRCHQTAFKGSAPNIRWRRSRKEPEGEHEAYVRLVQAMGTPCPLRWCLRHSHADPQGNQSQSPVGSGGGSCKL